MHADGLNGLYVTDDLGTQSSGVYTALLATARVLKSAGGSPMVVGGVDGEDTELTAWDGMATGFRRIGTRRLGLWHGVRPWLEEHAASCDFVSVQSSWLLANSSIANWAEQHRKPLMLTAHGMFNPAALRVSNWKKSIARRTFLRTFFDQVRCYQALSDSEYETLRKAGVSQPICIIGNGLTLPAVCPESSQNANSRTLLYLGRLHPIKGIELLLNAWNLRRPSGWSLIVAGTGPSAYEHKLRSIVSGRGDVQFVGFVAGPEKEELLRDSTALVLPSLSEALPMTALEGWSYGKPVLLTTACQLTPAVAAGAALETEPTVEGLISGLERLFSISPGALIQMGCNGRNFVSHEYSWNRIQTQLISVYEWLCGRASAPACVKFD